mgnify:FL=1
MIMTVSENTKAILLLTAPLLLGAKSSTQYNLLKPKEYGQLASYLVRIKKQPADLLTDQAEKILDNYSILDKSRIIQLLSRGFLLSQAIENWQSRGIWVISRADEAYPNRLKSRLKEKSPAILYGCGDVNLLHYGGLAVVGSRKVDNELITYTQNIACLSAKAQKMIISGGAKGVDSAAMYGALEANGWACGVLADGLEKATLNPDNYLYLQNSKLVLISACDPKSGFNIANAMQRNKYIYALADAALVVNSDLNKGGTWSGAVEQLDKAPQIPIYIRSTGSQSDGLNALKNKGALLWTNPNEMKGFLDIFHSVDFPHASNSKCESPVQMSLLDVTSLRNELDGVDNASPLEEYSAQIKESVSFMDPKPDDLLFIYVSKLIRSLTRSSSKKDSELAAELGISTSQMRIWLKRLVDEKSMIKENRPIKYRWKES